MGSLMDRAEHALSENNIARDEHSLVVKFLCMTMIQDRLSKRILVSLSKFCYANCQFARKLTACVTKIMTRLTVFKRATYSSIFRCLTRMFLS